MGECLTSSAGHSFQRSLDFWSGIP